VLGIDSGHPVHWDPRRRERHYEHQGRDRPEHQRIGSGHAPEDTKGAAESEAADHAEDDADQDRRERLA
jgi:hypothetical protein